MAAYKVYDVAVVGAGVFGAWTAYQLQRAGKKVALLDAYGPANSRASSGGESRVIRMGYGPDELYTRWAMRAFRLWQEYIQYVKQPLFHQTGVLWMARDNDRYAEGTLRNLEKLGVRFEKLIRSELEGRYPQIDFGSITWGILEPESGALMARRAVQAVVEEAVRSGVDYFVEAIAPPAGEGRLDFVTARSGATLRAETFVFACGAWLPKVFPELLRDRISPTRQEVYFLGVPAGDRHYRPPALPIWVDFSDEIYCLPDLEGRGVKVGFDRHGPAFDPDTDERIVNREALDGAERIVRRILPGLKDAPVVETRVCQYENTSSGDFLIDRHPALENVWIVGGGSGHGFKHGPVVGEYVARRIAGSGAVEPRFSLATKDRVQRRAVY